MNEERSPYTAPESEIELPVDADGYQLASRWRRLGGAIIDGLLYAVPVILYFFMTDYLERSMQGEVTDVENFLFGLGGIVAFLILQGYLLATSGQTIAKRMLGMQIVSVDDNRILPIGKLFGLRYLPFFIAAYIPYVGNIVGLVNALFIFGEEKRCLHDHLAGTRVIRVSDEPAQAWD